MEGEGRQEREEARMREKTIADIAEDWDRVGPGKLRREHCAAAALSFRQRFRKMGALPWPLA